MKPIKINDIPTELEWHIHIDSLTKKPNFLKSAIPEFFTNHGGAIGFEHNFDDYLSKSEALKHFLGHMPVEHASKYWIKNSDLQEKLKNLTAEYISKLNETEFKGCVEYELVQEAIYPQITITKDLKISLPAFETNKIKGKIYPNLIYFELHFTVPSGFLLENIELFEKLNLKGVSLYKKYENKPSGKYIVFSSLYKNLESIKMVYSYLYHLNTGFALKFEQKVFLFSKGMDFVNVDFLKII